MREVCHRHQGTADADERTGGASQTIKDEARHRRYVQGCSLRNTGRPTGHTYGSAGEDGLQTETLRRLRREKDLPVFLEKETKWVVVDFCFFPLTNGE